jgi:hypothetical protein
MRFRSSRSRDVLSSSPTGSKQRADSREMFAYIWTVFSRRPHLVDGFDWVVERRQTDIVALLFIRMEKLTVIH